jgi:hypothetical protein
MIQFVIAFVICVQAYLLFGCLQTLRKIAAESERKKELADLVKKFGTMFAEASGEADTKRKKKAEKQFTIEEI